MKKQTEIKNVFCYGNHTINYYETDGSVLKNDYAATNNLTGEFGLSEELSLEQSLYNIIHECVHWFIRELGIVGIDNYINGGREDTVNALTSSVVHLIQENPELIKQIMAIKKR